MSENNALKADYFIYNADGDTELFLPQFLAALLRNKYPKATINSAVRRYKYFAKQCNAAVALEHHSGDFLGVIFYETPYKIGELSYPYNTTNSPHINRALLEIATAECKKIGAISLRIERQLILSHETVEEAEDTGYFCQKRYRMTLEQEEEASEYLPPTGIILRSVNIKFLEEMVNLLLSANQNTKDAEMFHPLLSDREHCKNWLLRVMSGVYGDFLPASRLAFRGNDIIGVCLIVELDENVAGIMEISVAHEARGRGVGISLMSKSLKILRDDGYDTVDLSVTLGNDNAFHIYKKFNFKETGMYTVCYRGK